MEPQEYPGAKALLEKFHAGKCTPEELALLDAWYDRLGTTPPDDLSATDLAAQREAFLTNFRSNMPQPRVYWLFRPAVKRMLAACIILLAGLSFIWLQTRRPMPTPLVNQALVVTNGSGAIKKVTLPDSSEVWLNANASLRWEENTTRKERHLTLTGEGFFDVRKNSGQPFIIHTRDLAIRVLGTAFSIEAYPGEKMTRVSLLRGKVQVKANGDSAVSTILQPGYAAMYNKGDKGMRVAAANMDLAASWKEGGFAVTGISMHDAVTRLCERHGYRVKWKNIKDAEKNITVSFPRQSFEKMLGNLCYMNHKQFEISGKLVTIY